MVLLQFPVYSSISKQEEFKLSHVAEMDFCFLWGGERCKFVKL